MSAIRIEKLGFSYGPRPVLKDISLNIARNRFSVILGKNGCGKSTLFKVLAGIETHKTGRVTVLGRKLAQLSSHQRARLIGYLPQQHKAVFPFSVADVVLTGRASHVNLIPKPVDRQKAGAAMQQVGISHLKHRPFTELSGGEQQLAMIARVIAQEPEVILLDEPISHLDIFNQARVLGLVRELVTLGFTVVAVLHDPNSAFLYGDDFIFLRKGTIRTPGQGQEPWDRRFLEAIYDSELVTVQYRGRALVVPSSDALS